MTGDGEPPPPAPASAAPVAPATPAAPARRRRPGRSGAGGGGAEFRVDHQPGFVLHATPWRETSLVLDVLSRDHGRVALVARGAKRPTSQFRGLLAPFGSLALSWSGKGEVRTLVRVEWMGTLAPLRGEALLSAFYVNELLVRLLPRADPHPALFGDYVAALAALARGSDSGVPPDAALRAFELDLLVAAGHAPRFDLDDRGEAVLAGRRYRVDAERGIVALDDAAGPATRTVGEPRAGEADEGGFDGTVLLAMAARRFDEPGLRTAVRDVLRGLIRYHLHGRPLNTRRIFQDLKAL